MAVMSNDQEYCCAIYGPQACVRHLLDFPVVVVFVFSVAVTNCLCHI